MRTAKRVGPWAGCLAALALLTAACSAAPGDNEMAPGAEVRWIETPQGRLKAEVYRSEHVGDHPILVVVLHGDLPDPTYQYEFAQTVTRGLAASSTQDNVVAVGLLRPGYSDGDGDRSEGDMGDAIADNYTAEVIDAVAFAIAELKAELAPRAVVLVGHSGGGAIVANVLGRHPDLADAALLVACGCDPQAWRRRMFEATSNPRFAENNPSLLPIDLAGGVRQDATVRLVVGEQDETTLLEDSTRYADLLRSRGVDAQVTTAPGLGHNILFAPIVFVELERLMSAY